MIIETIRAGTLLSLALISLPATAQLNVLACEPEWASLAKAIGGDQVRVESITTAFQDPHHIEARPSLILKARHADVLFCTGAELEIGWLPRLLDKSANADIQAGKPAHFLASEQVELIEQAPDADRSQGDVHAAGNPHLHWDPRRLLSIAHAFASTLQQLDADNTSYYQQQLSAFDSQWRQNIERWETATRPLQDATVFVYHKNWSYLLDWLQIDTSGDLEPKPGIPPTSGHLSTLLSQAREETPQAILVANYQDRKGADWLSGKSDVPVLELPFTVGGEEQAIDLPSLYDTVISKLLQTLPAQ